MIKDVFSFLGICIGKNTSKECREKEIIKGCGCVCRCYVCGEPLNDKSNCEDLGDDGLYEYTCSNCNTKSRFHFGIAPVPIRMTLTGEVA